jgi:hypothetical protein
MFGFLRSKPLTHTQRVTLAEALAVPSQAIGRKRERVRIATENGLIACLPPEKAEPIVSQLRAARAAQ